jgi:hypothetical protein
MQNDRELIELARANLSVEQIATKMKFAPAKIIKVVKWLGLHPPPVTPKRNGKLTAKR